MDTPRLRATLQRAYRYALALVGDAALAEDLLGEACVSVARAGGRWDEAYVLTAVRTRFVDHCRGARAAAPVPLDGVDAATPCPAPDNGETRAWLSRAIDGLRLEEREALYLHVVAGYSASQIGKITGQPRSTILSLLQRSRRKLADQYRTAGARGETHADA